MKDNANTILKIDQTQGILRLLLNDPKNKNALSDQMMIQLKEQLFKASSNDSIKVIIIAAVGDVFCSGHNLKDITDARSNADDGKSYFLDLFNLCSSLMQMIISCSKPVIAEINGIATAAGCQLVASCDLAIASDSSKFATPGVNIGLFCSTPMVALSRNVSKKEAMKMLLTGEMIDAVEAKRVSLINIHVPSEKLQDEVLSIANKISSKPLATLKIGKEAFYKQYEMSLSEAYDFTSKVMTENSLADDAKEGIASFLEKREAVWKDD
ncbi:MAG: enoyl-CoA hydratase [SAR86 cluster bacterium]|uniref:Enoyl-CoA hydratase domain-containing protein 3, mitochondrial n=1 Tax=SAR86 cluster bacterium TaxID=2030880 RepID=A0A838XZI8_9GAMM|nr:enoyl-CoA hydratase [SAR86 cluster bacterium]|tara:strand:- start:164 stop:967 length:804 start_codon:yes stop_codon:yes gene_type:complete